MIFYWLCYFVLSILVPWLRSFHPRLRPSLLQTFLHCVLWLCQRKKQPQKRFKSTFWGNIRLCKRLEGTSIGNAFFCAKRTIVRKPMKTKETVALVRGNVFVPCPYFSSVWLWLSCNNLCLTPGTYIHMYKTPQRCGRKLGNLFRGSLSCYIFFGFRWLLCVEKWHTIVYRLDLSKERDRPADCSELME